MTLWRRVYQERRSVMLPLLVFLVANVAVLALVVLPLSANVGSLQNDAETAATSLLRARLLEKQANDAVGSKDQADSELQKFYAEILPVSDAGARQIMSFLARTAAENGLEFNRVSQEEESLQDSQLMRRTGTVTLAGSYANMRKFLYAVETAEEFVIIERVGLAQAQDLRSDSGQLEVVLNVATYYVPSGPPSPQ
jgi:Tfp pilus assembly protein PilO